MYTRDPFRLPSMNAVYDFVRRKSFGVVATYLEDEVHTSPLPFDLRSAEDDTLFIAAHVACRNEMTKTFTAGRSATITVLGPDTYVPAEWFGTRGRIPTWIYGAVEISGRIVPCDRGQTRDDVICLIDRLQKKFVENSTWSLSEMPEQLVTGYLSEIVGFRLHDLAFKSCFRLNQHSGESENLAASLKASGIAACQELATLVTRPPTALIEG